MQDYIHHHLVTKDELQQVLQKELGALRSEIMTHIDGLAMNIRRFDEELAAGIARDDRLEERIVRLERRCA